MKNFKLDQNTNTSVDEPQVRLAWFFKKYKIEKNIRLAAQQLYKSVEKSHDILEKCRIQLITSDRKIDYYFSEIKALSYYNTVNGPHNSIANSQRLSIKSDNNISITEKSDTLPYSLSSSKSLAHQVSAYIWFLFFNVLSQLNESNDVNTLLVFFWPHY